MTTTPTYPSMNSPKAMMGTMAANNSPTVQLNKPIIDGHQSDFGTLNNSIGFQSPVVQLTSGYQQPQSFQSTFGGANQFQQNQSNFGFGQNNLGNSQYNQFNMSQMMQNQLLTVQQFRQQQIQNKIQRPILPKYHQNFYNSLSKEQKLQFFGASTALQNTMSSTKWQACSKEIKLPQYGQQGMQGMQAPMQMQMQMSMPAQQPMNLQPMNPLPAQPSLISQQIQSALQVDQPSFTSQYGQSTATPSTEAQQQKQQQQQQQSCLLEQLKSQILEEGTQRTDLSGLFRDFTVSPSLEEINLDPQNVSNFSFGNEFGEVQFSQPVNLRNVLVQNFKLQYGDFQIPDSLKMEKFIVILKGIYCQNQEILREQAEKRGLQFVFYNQELKKLIMSSK